jgi:hypothetical protein
LAVVVVVVAAAAVLCWIVLHWQHQWGWQLVLLLLLPLVQFQQDYRVLTHNRQRLQQ